LSKTDRAPIVKALTALTWLVQEQAADVGVRELAAAMSVSPSSAHRLLATLTEVGFLRQDERTARYSLGLEFPRLCHIATTRLPIRQAALPYMTQLASQCGETVLLGLYDRERQKMMFAANIDAPHPLRYVIELNAWLPIHAGASGLAIMSFLSDEEVDTVIKRADLQRITDKTLTNPTQLRKFIKETRLKGYAKTKGQRIQGAVGVAASIFGSDKQVIGDICVTIPEQRYDASREKVLLSQILLCAKNVSAELSVRKLA
jgi:IclR family acetate operon transcriptional repressor